MPHAPRECLRASVGKAIDTLLRNDLLLVDELWFAPLDDTSAQLLFRFVAAAYERRSLGIGSHWPFESWAASCPNTPPPSACSTDSYTTATPVVTDGDSYRMRRARAKGGTRLKTS